MVGIQAANNDQDLVRVKYFGNECLPLAKQVIKDLAEKGVKVELDIGLSVNAGTAIVLFQQDNPDVYDWIRKKSCDGSECVIAILDDIRGLECDSAWHILEAGASDIITWDPKNNPISMLSMRLIRWQEVDRLLNTPEVQEKFVGTCKVWRIVTRQIIEAARYTDSPILLIGETGTGKELAAQLIHSLDLKRSKYNFEVLDCTTIVPDLSGSELFGHDRGAFTGAINTRDGAFAKADKGSLFLDELGELPPNLQVQLLRVLQEHVYKRVGSDIWRETDFRLICASNRDLINEGAIGHFRSDLYYRIAVWTFKLPPLRERRDDILLLAKHFIKQENPQETPPELELGVQKYLLAREYPGNVRDLKNLMARIMACHVGTGPITLGDIPTDEWPKHRLPDIQSTIPDFDQAIRYAMQHGMGLKDLATRLRTSAIRIAVEDENGNLQKAAKRLGVSDRSLQLWRADRHRISKV